MWEPCAAGYRIHWPKIDEDLSVEGCSEARRLSVGRQGARRATPSLMNTRNGVVPEALPSRARHLPSVQSVPPWTCDRLELDDVGVDLAVRQGGSEVGHALVADDDGVVLPDHHPAAAGALEGVLQDRPALVVLLGAGGPEAANVARVQAKAVAIRSSRRSHGSSPVASDQRLTEALEERFAAGASQIGERMLGRERFSARRRPAQSGDAPLRPMGFPACRVEEGRPRPASLIVSGRPLRSRVLPTASRTQPSLTQYSSTLLRSTPLKRTPTPRSSRAAS